MQGGQYHNMTSKEARRQNRKDMMDFPSGGEQTKEIKDLVVCACINCHKLFFATYRYMQDKNTRNQAFEAMEGNDVE